MSVRSIASDIARGIGVKVRNGCGFSSAEVLGAILAQRRVRVRLVDDDPLGVRLANAATTAPWPAVCIPVSTSGATCRFQA